MLKGLSLEKIKKLLKIYRLIYIGPFEKGVKSGEDGK